MGKTIYMPDAEQSRQLLEQAWDDFNAKMHEAGFIRTNDEEVIEILKEVFIGGYCYGHNDALEVILSQLNVDAQIEDFLKGGLSSSINQ